MALLRFEKKIFICKSAKYILFYSNIDYIRVITTSKPEKFCKIA